MRSPRSALLFVLALCGQTSGTQRTPRRYEFTEVHMGMSVRTILYADNDSIARAAARAAFQRIATLDNTMSDYRPQSELRGLEHRRGEWVPVSAELFDVIARAVEIARLTGGAFDPTVAPVVALWREARRTGQLPDRVRLDSARALVGWRRIALDSARRAVRLEPGMRLDLGGIAKGYIIQEALGVLRAAGVTQALIEAGGDIVAGDAPPGDTGWRVDAPGASHVLAARLAAVANSAVSTSGPTAQFTVIAGVRYSHVVDPRTGMALTNGVIARVHAPDAATADALATALTVLGVKAGEALIARVFPDVKAEVRPDSGGHAPRLQRVRLSNNAFPGFGVS